MSLAQGHHLECTEWPRRAARRRAAGQQRWPMGRGRLLRAPHAHFPRARVEQRQQQQQEAPQPPATGKSRLPRAPSRAAPRRLLASPGPPGSAAGRAACRSPPRPSEQHEPDRHRHHGGAHHDEQRVGGQHLRPSRQVPLGARADHGDDGREDPRCHRCDWPNGLTVRAKSLPSSHLRPCPSDAGQGGHSPTLPSRPRGRKDLLVF